MWFDIEMYCGCVFINFVVEFGMEIGDVQLVEKVVLYKVELVSYLVELVKCFGYLCLKVIVEEVLLCVEGMIVWYQMIGECLVVDVG